MTRNLPLVDPHFSLLDIRSTYCIQHSGAFSSFLKLFKNYMMYDACIIQTYTIMVPTNAYKYIKINL